MLFNEQLVLIPGNIQYRPENIPALLDVLQQAGLTGAAIADSSSYRFDVGENFSELISFLGCSPGIPGSSKRDGSCIEFVFYDSGSQFLGGKNTSNPCCPECKHQFKNWQQLLQQWQDNNNTLITCPDCNHESLIPKLNWRYRAAFASCAIIINEISEGVALPADGLLEILKDLSGCDWLYFYRQV